MNGDKAQKDLARLARKIGFDAPGACWRWTANKDAAGYAHFWFGGRTRLAHRIVYELLVGPIPTGLELDHLCRNRGCVNPAHLEPVTGQENVLRSDGVAAKNALKTHCPAGHEYAGESLYVTPDGHRVCRTCRREIERAWRRARAIALRGSVMLPPSERTHCPAGHEYAGENLIVRRTGGRNCRACAREQCRAYRARRKEAA